jgi:hypothetical protein
MKSSEFHPSRGDEDASDVMGLGPSPGRKVKSPDAEVGLAIRVR